MKSFAILLIQILFSQQQGWAKRTIRQILLDSNADISMRRNILDKLSYSKSKFASYITSKLAQATNDPLSLDALTKLVNLNTSIADGFLWKLVKNPNIDDDVRFLAAKALHPRHGKAVISALQGS